MIAALYRIEIGDQLYEMKKDARYRRMAYFFAEMTKHYDRLS